MPKISKDKPVFGDGTRYKKKGDRCSCICHDPKNNLPLCKKCKDELWPGELCAIEKYREDRRNSSAAVITKPKPTDAKFAIGGMREARGKPLTILEYT